MTAAAVSNPIRPDLAISPARHAAQKVRLFRWPSGAPATTRTSRASARSSGMTGGRSSR